MEIIELRRGDFIYRGAAGRGMGVFYIYYRPDQASGKVYILNVIYSKRDQLKALKQLNLNY